MRKNLIKSRFLINKLRKGLNVTENLQKLIFGQDKSSGNQKFSVEMSG